MRTVACGLAVAVVALAGCGADPPPSAIAPDATPSKSQPVVSTVTPGGKAAFQRRLAKLRGTPVVVNQWASWCGPCRSEFPFFQTAATERRGRVAFLGLNAGDRTAKANAFLRQYPTPYRHIEDPDGKASMTFGGGRAFPTTAFYDADGEVTHVMLGAYPTQETLDADIDRYATR